MRKGLLILSSVFFLFLFSGCKDRFTTIGNFPASPGVKIFALGSLHASITDSIKLSNPNYSYYGLDVRLSDSDKYYTSLVYVFTQGSGTLINRSDTLHGLLPFFNYRSQSTFYPVGEGLSNIKISATDQFRNTAVANISLFTFRNLIPVTSFTVTPIRAVDSLEYLIDASSSVDPDQHFGGGIAEYIYSVENNTLRTTQNQIKHIFSSSGVFTISVQTLDNDGALSKVAVQQITVTP